MFAALGSPVTGHATDREYHEESKVVLRSRRESAWLIDAVECTHDVAAQKKRMVNMESSKTI